MCTSTRRPPQTIVTTAQLKREQADEEKERITLLSRLQVRLCPAWKHTEGLLSRHPNTLLSRLQVRFWPAWKHAEGLHIC